MRRRPPFVRSTLLRILSAAVLSFCGDLAFAQERVPWTGSRIQGTPDPAPPFIVERMYPGLTFSKPLDVTPIPGTDRLVVLEEEGKMYSFLAKGGVEKADLFGDLPAINPEVSRSSALAFHPRFAENRFVYTWNIIDPNGNRKDGTRIVRFRVTEENPPRLDPSSAKLIISWPSGGHNGGNIRFGPDGMMYISTGDGTRPDPPDRGVTGQDVSDLLSSVLRLDVDHPEEGKGYSIPKDNPFIDLPKARGEVWAYGLRNPWRMSFDPKSGELFLGDVGWELWEMIYRIRRGGNYGWSITEGGQQDVRPDRLRGPTPILPPLVAHSHEEAASITGGEFYYGSRLPELKGAYLYGDWQMGTFWSLRAEGDKVTERRELCRSSLMPAGFGVASDGELIIADHSGGGLWRLTRNPRFGKESDFPRKLSQTGLFTDTAQQVPAPGVLPYEVHAPRWADHAMGQRWVGFPGKSGVTVAEEAKGVVVFPGQWAFPEGAVLAKTYSLEMERGNPDTRRRVETQILHFDGSLWGTYSYRWNAEQTDAELMPSRGGEATFQIKDKAAPGGELQQRWRFFSRSECARCHNLFNAFAQGFSSLQLDVRTPAAKGRQLDLLTQLGLTPDEPKFANPRGTVGSLETRARSWLHVNCSVCHRYNGGGVVPSYMNVEVALKEASLLEFKPVRGDLGLPDARVIARGDPGRSVLLYRMATAGRGHMPYLGSQLIDDRGLLLMRDWIASIPPAMRGVGPTTIEQRVAEDAALQRLKAGDITGVDALLASGSGALSVALAIIDGSIAGPARVEAIAKGSALADPLRRDLFERFLPESKRRQLLGPEVQPAVLLAMKGDAARGKAVFAGLCAACHRAEGVGIDFGPDLSHVGSKWKSEGMIEQILAPSKIVEPQWKLTTVELKSGESKVGFPAGSTETELSLKQAGGVIEKIAVAQIAKTSEAAASTMPEGLLQTLTAQEASDLLEYLGNLK
jgi:putative heme-binding domain-containing protein